MPFFLLSDDAHDHPKVEAAGNEAFGLWARMGSYSSRQLTNGRVPATVVTRYGTPDSIARLVDVGLFEIEADGNGEIVAYVVHDYLDHNPCRQQILDDRRVKKAAGLDPELRGRVKARDGNWCRYQGCGRLVSWGDRRTFRGGVLDIVDPDRPVDVDNLVVACRGCQKAHRGRSADEAGMTLGPARGGQPGGGPGRGFRPTATRPSSGPNLGTSQNRSGSDPDSSQIRSESSPEPIQNPGPYPVPPPLRGGGGTGGTTHPPVTTASDPTDVAAVDMSAQALASAPAAATPTPTDALPLVPSAEQITRNTLGAEAARLVLVKQGRTLKDRRGKPLSAERMHAYHQRPLPMWLEPVTDRPSALAEPSTGPTLIAATA